MSLRDWLTRPGAGGLFDYSRFRVRPPYFPPFGGDRLHAGLDAPLPSEAFVGKGTVLQASGWAFHPSRDVRSLEALLDGTPSPVLDAGGIREDVALCYARDDPRGNSLTSGFWFLLPLGREHAGSRVSISLRATFADGSSEQARLGEVSLHRETRSPIPLPTGAAPGGGPLVAVCMAHYEPDPARVRRQIESLRAQSHRNWIAVVQDDASPGAEVERLRVEYGGDGRLVFLRNARNLGFCGNFQEALRRVPREAEFVAFADQDDVWHPGKIRTLLAALEDGATLAYGDMRIVDGGGRTVADSFWERRTNQWTDLEGLLLGNTVTGAACLFRASLLDLVLPFPPDTGNLCHDHWTACCALAVGRIAFVDEPIQDYVQHGGNVVGAGGTRSLPRGGRLRALATLLQSVQAQVLMAIRERPVPESGAPVTRLAMEVHQCEYRRMLAFLGVLSLRETSLFEGSGGPLRRLGPAGPRGAGAWLRLLGRGLGRADATCHAEARLFGSLLASGIARRKAMRGRSGLVGALGQDASGARPRSASS